MADALHSMRDDGNLQVTTKDKLNQAIQYFLDRLYMSRISIQMLIAHHKSLFCSQSGAGNPSCSHQEQGTIDPQCDPVKVAQEAYENAAFLCDQIYMDSPKMNITCSNVAEGTDKINFVYIPTHLYHMFFEVFKNSMRATMEFNENAETVPEIDVHIVKSSHDITIKVSDRGGGISRNVAENVFLYLYTSGKTFLDQNINLNFQLFHASKPCHAGRRRHGRHHQHQHAHARPRLRSPPVQALHQVT